jgi:mono/diheme cytochrome c family protein
MSIRRVILLALASVPLLAAAASAQQKPTGAELIASKCFQCHTQAMWQDQRQDTRAWEANLYRMVGRGALWTPEEISAMADYLAEIRGSISAKATVDEPVK